MSDVELELQMDLKERLHSLNAGINPADGLPQELIAALHDAQEIVSLLKKLIA